MRCAVERRLVDEREAVARLKRGDISGLEMLAKTYQVQATRAADLIVRDRALAEDIVTDTLLRVHERRYVLFVAEL